MEKKTIGVKMKVLYAPSKREYNDDLHGNVACGFDVMVLETLVGLEMLEVSYLPHIQTSLKIVESIKDIFGDSIDCCKNAPKKIEVVVSDVSNMVFKYAFLTQKPSILCLFGFNGITYPTNDKYYSMLESVTHNVYSLEELKKAFLEYSVIQKAKITKIQEFFRGAVI